MTDRCIHRGAARRAERWLVSSTLSLHEATAAELGCMLLEDARCRDPLLRPVTCTGERSVRIFGLVAKFFRRRRRQARALLVASIPAIRPMPLWMSAAVMAGQPSDRGRVQGARRR